MFDDTIRELLGFIAGTKYEEYTPSNNPVDILSFDNLFLATNIAPGSIFRGKRSGIIFNWSRDVNPGFKYIHKVRR